MAFTTEGGFEAPSDSPSLRVIPKRYLFPYEIQVIGSGWGDSPITLRLDGERNLINVRVIQGRLDKGVIHPENGGFLCLFNLPDLSPGEHEIAAIAGDMVQAADRFTIEAVPEIDADGRPTYRPFRRQEHSIRYRFLDGNDPSPDARLSALNDRNSFMENEPVSEQVEWYSIGPSVVLNGKVFGETCNQYTTAPVSGRISTIAIDPDTPNIVYAGAACGGVWKSTDGGINWFPKSDSQFSLAMGCITVAKSGSENDQSKRIFVGTGEPNGADSYYGGGMLFSEDGGENWELRGHNDFKKEAFSTILVDPRENQNQHLYAATSNGVWESENEGANWKRIRGGTAFFDLVADWRDPNKPTLYVGESGFGVLRSQDGGKKWNYVGDGLLLSPSPKRVALAMSPSRPEVLYAALASFDSNGLNGIFRTDDCGKHWQRVSAPPCARQTNYNLVMAVNPSDHNTVLFGEVHLWRTTDGGINWEIISTGNPGIHADQHAITFHPKDRNQLYVGNDGGLFYSDDGGNTFQHRNKGLVTLQYYSIGQHPEFEAVIIGGTQDNGAQRYSGHPAWEHSAKGDSAFVMISRNNSKRWYQSQWHAHPCYRSDMAGAPGSWVEKCAGIETNTRWFIPPLVMDPNQSNVLYVGYDRLWRTEDHAETWSTITTEPLFPGKNITAIAVARSDSEIIYVGLENGYVFKITFDVERLEWVSSDIPSEPVSDGQISDIAIHPGNADTVYVTTSNIVYSIDTDEYDTDHVYLTTDGGASWNSRSAGLSSANPVNAIVIDPKDPKTMFIGADDGIYRSKDGGENWTPWDKGLPNCPVIDLQFFAPLRLLRAATHGRSVWERPVDEKPGPITDVYMRDNIIDTGLRTPTPSDVGHPFDEGKQVFWFESVDIKIDTHDQSIGTFQTSSLDIDFIQFEEMAHLKPRRGETARVFVQVHCRGSKPATNTQVRAFWADATNGFPDFPADFWNSFPGSDPPDTSTWHPLGPMCSVEEIFSGLPEIMAWDWSVPGDAPDTACILCAVNCSEDPVRCESLNVEEAVRNNNNITLKKIHLA